MKNLTILIDYPNLFKTTYYAIVGSNNEKLLVDRHALSMSVQASLLKKIASFPLSLVKSIVLFNDQGKNWRYEKMPLYKATRPNREVLVEELQDYCLSRINLPCFSLDKFEADDLIASAVFSWNNLETDDLFVIVSNDHDFYQLCFYKNVAVLSQVKGELMLIKDLKSSKNFEPSYAVSQVKKVDSVYELYGKVFLGCQSDNVPKLLKRGLGEKALLKAYESCREVKPEDMICDKFFIISNRMAEALEIPTRDVAKQLEIVSLRVSHLNKENAHKMHEFFTKNPQPEFQLPLNLSK